MIVCLNCGKENQDHFKFCLGCGAKLPGPGAGTAAQRPAPRPPVRKPAAPRTVVAARRPDPAPVAPPPPGVSAGSSGLSTPPVIQPPSTQQNTPVAQAAVPVAQMAAPVAQTAAPVAQTTAPVATPATPPRAAPTNAGGNACSSCGMANPPGFRFCGGCGSSLAPPAPKAPTPIVQTSTPTPLPTTPRPPVGSGKARLTLIRIDGSEGGSIDINGGPMDFGRSYGSPFDADFYLSPQHCKFTVLDEGLVIDDIAGTNGVYRKLNGRIPLEHGDTFRVGQELLYYEDLPEPAPLADGTERMGSPNPGYWGRVSLILEGGIASEAFPIEADEFTVGRENGDITFPLDGYVSSSHCRIVGDDTGVFLEDRGSSNGTYVRLRPGSVAPYGTLILAGQQLFRIDRA